jgi:hypothetical protein
MFEDAFIPPALPAATTASTEALQAPLISATEAFSLHSKPGSKNIIYLDFDGMNISNTAWNTEAGAPVTYYAQAYDTDGSPNTYSTAELNSVAAIWYRIAEDYKPFNVDVTTKQPAKFGPTVGRILITNSIDKNGAALPGSSGGGIAYIDAWGSLDYAYYSPALVYYNHLGNGYAAYVAEAASHEMGHNLGLSHDGSSTTGYYSGLGTGFVSWAPIMGNGYYKNVTEWSKGEYPDANNQEDDIAIIKAKLGYRADDHGNTADTATPLTVNASGSITSTNVETDPFNTDQTNKGVISKSGDTDFFSFYSGAGAINISITPAWDAFYDANHRGANLDIQATLYSWDGKLIQKFDPINETKATIAKTVDAGQYYLAIRAVGNTVTPYSKYASMGQYYIRGTVKP